MLHTGSPRTRSLISIHTVHTLPSTGHSKTGSKRHQGSREHIAALRTDLFAMIYVWAASGSYCEQHHGRDVASVDRGSDAHAVRSVRRAHCAFVNLAGGAVALILLR